MNTHNLGYNILCPKARFCGKANACGPSSANSQPLPRIVFSSLFFTRLTRIRSCDTPTRAKHSNFADGRLILELCQASSNTPIIPNLVVSTLVSPQTIVSSILGSDGLVFVPFRFRTRPRARQRRSAWSAAVQWIRVWSRHFRLPPLRFLSLRYF